MADKESTVKAVRYASYGGGAALLEEKLLKQVLKSVASRRVTKLLACWTFHWIMYLDPTMALFEWSTSMSLLVRLSS
ncbi:hypothetical protein OPV22_000459 [Ensete ventricosum]|uniref:Uncharacterized protein n=1 Tax=Ensete ventricosum TaxID=4639 RepID=A0AAV8RUP6_ENSVE|nr:hypothetical protein OPV22_000459 [Ensete ventricosum]